MASVQPIAAVSDAPARRLAARATRLLSAVARHPHIIALVVILGIGLGLRTYRLGDVPAGFFADEASIGYNAYTLLTRGTDEYGVAHPMFFRAFGEYKSPVQIYSTVPFIAVFGRNEVAVRLTSVFYGELCLVAVYLLVRELFASSRHRELLALLSALLLAISPWHIHFSRVSLEGLMPWVVFTTLGLYLFLKAQTRPKLMPVAIIAFAVALYSYFPARLFIPLFGIGLCSLYARFFFRHVREMLLSAAALVICLFPFVQNLFATGGLARWQQVSIFAHPPTGEPIWQHIVRNYLSHFSLDFLFTKGDIDMPGQFISRHSVRGLGELYLYQLPLIVLGLLTIVYLARRKVYGPLVLLLWLILYPVGSMFTTDASAQATRSVIGVVPWQIVSALGLVSLFQVGAHLARRLQRSEVLSRSPQLATLARAARGPLIGALMAGILGAGLGAIVVLPLTRYVSLYFDAYTSYSSDFWGWQFGARDIVRYFVRHEAGYDDLVMAPEFNGPEIFFKFYAPGECGKCKVGLPDTSFQAGRRQLFAITPDYAAHYKGTVKTLQTIRAPSGKVAFLLVEIVKASP
jgi:hypothetical protein